MMLGVVERFPQPLSIFEIGASAGLNLAFDRYHYVLGEDREWGEPNAVVHIESEWRGAIPPLEAPLDVAQRQGCDRNPLDPRDPQATERLLAYVWAEQQARLARLSGALSAAARMDYSVERADGDGWVAARRAWPPG